MSDQYNFKGCLLSPIDKRDYKVKAASSVTFPSSFSLITPMQVKNQKNVSSCVAHALSSIMEYHDSQYGAGHTLSTNFIYGIQKQHCGHTCSGMYLRQACKIGLDLGTPMEIYCQGNDEVPTAHVIAEKAYSNPDTLTNANFFRLSAYARCHSNNDIKAALMNYGPVLCSINWRDTFKIDKDGVLYGEDTGDDGYHALVIYGWNEKGWLIQNSWGRNWGNGGKFILPYTYKIAEAWSIVDGEQDIDKNSNDDLHVIKPKRGTFMDLIYKIINAICNFFSKN